jgi:hypothetical protein
MQTQLMQTLDLQLMQQCERCRPIVESRIKNDTLKDYIFQTISSPRMLSGNPPPEHILAYFTGRLETSIKKQYFPRQILGASRELLAELKHDQERAKHPVYGSGLAFLLAILCSDQDSNPIALDLLLEKGQPKVSTPYFGKPTEQSLITLFDVTYNPNVFPIDKKPDAVDLFSQYAGLSQFSQEGIGALVTVDYDKGLALLPQVIDENKDPLNFSVAWNISRNSPVKVAHDLIVLLDDSRLEFFMSALELYSGGFQDSISKSFAGEIKKLRVKN